MKGTTENSIFYTPLQRRLHWIIVLLLVVQYVTQSQVEEALAVVEREETLSFFQFLVTTVHTWGGICIAAVMLWRWRLRRRQVPVAGGSLSPAGEWWVRLHHTSLYVALVLMALTGMLNYFAGVEWAARWHERGKWVILVLVAVHVAGALRHAAGGSRVLHRMMGRSSWR